MTDPAIADYFCDVGGTKLKESASLGVESRKAEPKEL